MRTEPRTQQRPEPLQRVDMHLAEPVTVIIAGELARRVADRLVVVAPVVQTAVDVRLIGVNHTPPGDRLLDQGADRHLLDVLQHPDHDLTAALQHPEDRRLLLGQRAPASLPLQPPPAPAPPLLFYRLGIALMSGHHIDFVALDLARQRRFGTPLDDPRRSVVVIAWTSPRSRSHTLAIWYVERFRPMKYRHKIQARRGWWCPAK